MLSSVSGSKSLNVPCTNVGFSEHLTASREKVREIFLRLAALGMVRLYTLIRNVLAVFANGTIEFDSGVQTEEL